jgi:polyhydroxyalkanoate synthase
MEKWIFDSPDVPAATFRQFIDDCYKKNLLIQSKMELDGKRVDLKKITMPILNFYGKYDHLVPPEACELLTQHVSSTDTEDICLNTGHIGIYVSSKCQREFTPKIIRWLKEREGDDKQAEEKKPIPPRIADNKPQKEANGDSPEKKTDKEPIVAASIRRTKQKRISV